MKTLHKKDLIIVEEYTQNRTKIREDLRVLKSKRSLNIGPDARFMFECYETLWGQIQEMLYIEGGDDVQIEDELKAYGPLVPQGSELSVTVFFEIPNADMRFEKLSQWGGIEEAIFLQVGDEKIYATSGDELERTNAQGKTSAVHFLKFLFSEDQKNKFKKEVVVLGFDFEKYPHMMVLSDVIKEELSRDFS